MTLHEWIAVYKTSRVELDSFTIHAGWIPRETDLPAVAYQVVGGNETMTHQGGTGLITDRVQFSCASLDLVEAAGIRSLVRKIFLEAIGNDLGLEVMSSLPVGNRRDIFREAEEWWVCMIDFSISYREPE
jgi:hypothetical protein